MTITAGEQQSGGEVRDNDGRLIIVGPGGVAIGGGGGTVDITDRAGRLLGHVTVDNFPGTQPVSGPLTDAQLRALAVAVSGPLTDAQLRASAVPVSGTFFQATQPVSGTVTGNQGTPNTAANGWPAKVTDGTNTAQVLNAAPGSDTGQSAMAVRVISQLGAGSGGGGGTSQADKSAFVEGTGLVSPAGGVVNDTISADPAEDTAAALRLTAKRGLHVNLRNLAGAEVGTAAAPVRTDPTGGTAQPVTGTFFQATQPVSLATNTPDVTDRDARLAGRVKNLDSAGTVIDPALKGQLPAALVGGRLDINLGATIAVPVTDNGGSITVDAPVGTPLRVDPTGTTTQPVSIASIPTVVEKQDQPASTTATWTSATALNTALTNSTVTGYGTATVTIQTPSTATAGAITLEVTDDGTTWYPAGAVRVDNGLQENTVTLAGPGVAQSRMYAVSTDAMTGIRARLSTVIVGAGNTIVRIGLVAGGIEPLVSIVPQRNPVTIFLDSATGLTVEALATGLTIQRGDAAAVTGATTYAPTAGKTFRLLSITLTGHLTAAALTATKVRIRSLAAGTTLVTSPVRHHSVLRAPVTTGAAGTACTPVFVEAGVAGLLDVPPGGSLGVSHAAGAATYVLDVTLLGYEF